MRLFPRLIAAAIAAIAIPLLTPMTASAAKDLKPASGQVLIEPSYWCANPHATDPEFFNCTTTFEMAVGHGGEESRPEAVITLDRVGGGRVFTDPYGYFNWNLESEVPTGELSAGAYILRARVSWSGYWWCSQYNPNGCTWFEGGKQNHEWRFTYAPGQTKIVSPYQGPTTQTRDVKWKKASAKKVRLTGVVVGRNLRPDYTLTGSMAQPGRKVQYQEKVSGQWKTIVATTTNRAGKFTTRAISKKAKGRAARIVVEAKGGSPGVTRKVPVRR